MIKNTLEKIISRNSRKHKYILAGKRLNKLFNGISHGDYTLITGLPATGKRSFVDYYYVLRILDQWDKLDAEAKIMRPLKIIYFTTKYTADYKTMKWSSALFTLTSKLMLDVPTLLQGSGRLFNLNDKILEKIVEKSSLLDRAIDAGVLEIIDHNITPITIDKKLNDLIDKQGDIEYLDNGKIEFTPLEEFETALNIVIIDDINHISAGKSSFGEGNMERDEISSSLNDILSKYSKLGMAVTVVKRTDASKIYGKYVPSTKEIGAMTVTKCIVMYDPVTDRLKDFLSFQMEEFIDGYDINRLRFAYIAYNETGISNLYMPLLFTPENGIFVELKMMLNEANSSYNLTKFTK